MYTTLTVYHIEHIIFRMAQEMLAFDEPIPDFSTSLDFHGASKSLTLSALSPGNT